MAIQFDHITNIVYIWKNSQTLFFSPKLNEDVNNRDEAAENSCGAAEAVEPVADNHAAEAVPAQEMGADEESTFTPNFLTGVFTWGDIAGLPEKRKPVVMQYRAFTKEVFTKEAFTKEVFFYKINHLCDAL